MRIAVALFIERHHPAAGFVPSSELLQPCVSREQNRRVEFLVAGN